MILLLVYVDDVIITGNNYELMCDLVKSLDQEFALKDLGKLHHFLCFQVHYFEYGFILNQEKYVDDLLHKLQLQDLKPTPLSSVVGKHLSAYEGDSLDNPFLYWSTFGTLQYLTHTRLDIAYIVNHYIAYIVNHLSQFLQRPTDIHWQDVKRVL